MALNVAESVVSNKEDLKEWYTDDEIRNAVLSEGALYGLMPKYNRFKGKTLPIPLIYGDPQGASATFATAKANKSNSQEASFALTRFKDYALASIEREAKLASDDDKGAWMELAKIAIDGAKNQSSRSIAISEYRDGTGIRGQISSGSVVSTNTITLADINDVSNFECYMFVTFAPLRTGTVPRTGQAQIVAIDRNAGTLTFANPLNTIVSAVAAGDFIHRSGDMGLVSPGLGSWLVPPSLRPTAAGQDNFYGQDRFPDKTRLCGVYHDATSQPIEEGLIDLERKCARENARVTHMFMNNVQYGAMLKSLSTKIVYSRISENARSANGTVATVSFSGIEFQGAGGAVKVFPDFNCPSTKVFALTLPTWKLYSLGDAPHIFDMDNDQEWLRHDGADAYEVRVGAYYALGCRDVSKNGFADLAPQV